MLPALLTAGGAYYAQKKHDAHNYLQNIDDPKTHVWHRRFNEGSQRLEKYCVKHNHFKNAMSTTLPSNSWMDQDSRSGNVRSFDWGYEDLETKFGRMHISKPRRRAERWVRRTGSKQPTWGERRSLRPVGGWGPRRRYYGRRRTFPGFSRKYSRFRRKRTRSFRKMPKRYRRNYSSRRRMNKRRRFRSEVYRSISAPTEYMYETQYTLDKATGTYTFWAVADHMTAADVEGAWKDTGEGGSELVSAGSNQSEYAMLEYAKTQVQLRNLNLHPYKLTPYWLIPRSDIFHNTVALRSHVCDLLLGGWKDRMLDTDEVLASINLQDNSTSVFSFMKNLTPFHSSRLKRSFYIRRGPTRLVESGDETYFTWKMRRPRVVKYWDITDDDPEASGAKRRAIRGLTAVLLLKVEMALGKDTTTETEFTNLTGVIHANVFKKIRFRKACNSVPLIAVSNNKKYTAFTIEGDAPTEKDEKVDL